MQPYKGLQPYTEQDKDNFFGREAETRILIDQILTHKLTFLFAASGVGKSSLLQAAVLPALKHPTRMDREPLDVIYYTDWVGNPLETLKKSILADLQTKGQLTPEDKLDFNLPLPQFFHFCTALTSEPLVIILDQFEEFFNYQRVSEYFQPVIRELAEAIHDWRTDTAFVISMREDFALELNAFKDYIPTFLIDNFYRLEKLTLDNARLAIVEPVAKRDFHYEPALLEKLLEDLVLREQRERGLTEILDKKHLPPLVEPPHLQMICMQLWDLAQDNPNQQITRAIFEQKGGTEGLLKTYFLDKIKQLSGKEQKLASKSFDFLVNRHGTKMPRSLPDLANLIEIEAKNLAETLDKLETGRILRRQLRYGTATSEGILWYELHHDFFSKPIYDWNTHFKLTQRIHKFSLVTGSIFVAGALSFVAWDVWINATSIHLRLSVKSGLSDTVEVYQGNQNSYDIFGQQEFLYETVYERSDIEADKLFITHPVIEKEQLNTEMVGQLPIAERIDAYLANGDLDKALSLASCSISDNDMQLSEKVIKNLFGFRSVETFNLLGHLLKTEQNHNSRQKIVEVLGQYKAPNQVVPFLIAATEDRINSIREQAVKFLGKFRSAEVIEPLIVLLNDQDSYVRRQAAESLGKLGAKQAIEPLMTLLKDQNSWIRGQAARTLGQLGAKQAIGPLITLLKDKNLQVRGQAIVSLSQLGVRQVIIEPLIARLKGQNIQMQMEAAQLLGQIDTKQAIEPSIALLKGQNFNIRVIAAQLLGQLDAKQAIEPLMALLKDQSSMLRGQAAKSLGQLDAKQAIEPLMALLNDESTGVRQQVVKSLVQLDGKKAIKPLMTLLNAQDSIVRSYATESMILSATQEAIEPLITLLNNDPDFWVWVSVVVALHQLGTENLTKALITLFKEQNGKIRVTAASLILVLGTKKAIEPLITLLNDRNIYVQRQAIYSLGQLGTKQAIEPLIALLKEQDANVRMQAALSLGYLGSEQARKALMALLKDQNRLVQKLAAKLLSQLGVKEAIEPLIYFLKNQSSYEREQSPEQLELFNNLELLNNSEIEAFFKKSDKSHSEEPKPDIQQLFDSLEDDNVHTQKQAIESLGKMATNAPKESQTKILDKLTAIASNPQELFGTRIKALKNLGKLGTEAAAKRVIQIATEETGDYKESYRFAAYQALQDTDFPVALNFLKQELKKLAKQKQQWRKQRDNEKDTNQLSTNLDSFSTSDCTTATIVENEKRWRYGHWETELGYAIAQHDPEIAGLEMLAHPLANVRKGAWFGIAKIGVPTVEIIRKIHAERARSTEAYFRHAAFRAIDKSLITIEVYGTETDVQALKAWRAEVKDKAVLDRIDFTLAELEYRLSTTDDVMSTTN
jgi:HEAT repeat protein